MTRKLPTLEYSAPPAFFVGAFDHGRWQSWIAVVMILAMGVMSAFAAYAGRSFLHGLYSAMFGAASCFCFIGSARVLYLWCRKRQMSVRITEEGVEHGKNIWTWPLISRIGGMRSGAGITLFVFRKGFEFFASQLPTTPPLSEEQFTALMADLKAYLAERYANVEVHTEPEEGDALRGRRGIEKLERRQ